MQHACLRSCVGTTAGPLPKESGVQKATACPGPELVKHGWLHFAGRRRRRMRERALHNTALSTRAAHNTCVRVQKHTVAGLSAYRICLQQLNFACAAWTVQPITHAPMVPLASDRFNLLLPQAHTTHAIKSRTTICYWHRMRCCTVCSKCNVRRKMQSPNRDLRDDVDYNGVRIAMQHLFTSYTVVLAQD